MYSLMYRPCGDAARPRGTLASEGSPRMTGWRPLAEAGSAFAGAANASSPAAIAATPSCGGCLRGSQRRTSVVCWRTDPRGAAPFCEAAITVVRTRG